ncbi:MAG: ABC transporter substrate-binding protein, partial [Chitinophagales bacterium]|nr:ABC transporter substrate-binding protein [Chitinophagales bacterium]
MFIILFLFLPACKRETGHDGKSILKVNFSVSATSLDPAFASDQPNSWACNQLYNGLVQLDKNLQINPCIAKHWMISEDRLTYTFILRQDVV